MRQLVLPPMLDLPAATPLLAELIAARGEDLRLDASAVQRLGGQCLQVLLAGRAAWAADGRCLEVTPASAAFRDAADVMGAGAVLGLVEAGGVR